MFKNKEENLKKIKKLIIYLNEKIENKDINFVIMQGLKHFISQPGKVIVEDNYFEGVDSYNHYSFKIKISDSLIIIEETNFYGNLSTIYNIKFLDEKNTMTITREISKCVKGYSREVTSTETLENVKLYVDNMLRYENNTVFSVDYNLENNNYELDTEELFVANNSAVYSKNLENIFSGSDSKRLFISENSYYISNNYRSISFNNINNDTSKIYNNGFREASKEVFDNMKITQMVITNLVEENRNSEKISINKEEKLNHPKKQKIKKIFKFIKD